jgi:hypothetical protein
MNQAGGVLTPCQESVDRFPFELRHRQIGMPAEQEGLTSLAQAAPFFWHSLIHLKPQVQPLHA